MPLLCAGLLATTACGGTGPAPAGTTTPAGDSGTGGARTVELSIRGVDAQGLASVRVGVERVSVEVDGVAASVALRQPALELASGSPAVVASFSVPSWASSVRVAVELTPAGTWKGVAGSGPIDARGLPISFTGAAATMLQRGTLEIQMDAGASLQPLGAGMLALLPAFAIYF
jgi:hypothetical protein